MNYLEKYVNELENEMFLQIEAGLDAADILAERLANGHRPFMPDRQREYEYLVEAGNYLLRRFIDLRKLNQEPALIDRTQVMSKTEQVEKKLKEVMKWQTLHPGSMNMAKHSAKCSLNGEPFIQFISCPECGART